MKSNRRPRSEIENRKHPTETIPNSMRRNAYRAAFAAVRRRNKSERISAYGSSPGSRDRSAANRLS